MTPYDENKKPKRRRISKWRLDETSVVDKPAHTPARIAIMKRKGDTSTVEPIQKKLAMTSLTAGHAHSVIMVQAGSEGFAELRAGQTSFVDGHVHDWVMDDAGNIIFADAEGHNHGLSVLITKADDGINDDILAESILASLASDTEQASDSAATGGTEIKKMTPEEKAAKAAQDKQDELTKRAEMAESIVKLSPEQRAHFDALPTDEQGDFLNAENKDEIVKNASDENAVIYTASNGDTFRKNDDARMVKMAQERDKDREELAKERALRKRDDLLKRSGELLKNCSGTPDAKAALLGAVEGIKDEELRKAALGIVTAKDAGLQKAFETIGEAGNGEGTDANDKLDTLAKAYREKHPENSPEQAYVAVLDTDEGRKLHAQLTG